MYCAGEILHYNISNIGNLYMFYYLYNNNTNKIIIIIRICL